MYNFYCVIMMICIICICCIIISYSSMKIKTSITHEYDESAQCEYLTSPTYTLK